MFVVSCHAIGMDGSATSVIPTFIRPCSWWFGRRDNGITGFNLGGMGFNISNVVDDDDDDDDDDDESK